MDKPWFAQYPKNVPHSIHPETYASLVELLDNACQTYHSSIAYTHLGHDMTYAKLDETSRHLARFLQHQGFQKGARIAIMMPNGLHYPVALLAILRAGYVVVNTNPRYTLDELVHQLSDARVEGILAIQNVAHLIEEALPHVPTLKHILLYQLGDFFAPIKRWAVNAILRYGRPGIKRYHLPQAISFQHALQQGKTLPETPVVLCAQDLAFLQYTGGTTGISKGAMLSHGNMVANVLQTAAWVSPILHPQQEIIVTALPLYHVFSLTANALLFMHLGAKNILITDPRLTKHLIQQIKHQRFTAITGVSTLFHSLLHHAAFKTIDLSHLKLALAGGMALQPCVAEDWLNQTKTPLIQAYGLTEASPAVSINLLTKTPYPNSIGLPLPSTEIMIRDEYGMNVDLGLPGELCVRGPQVTTGYFGHPEDHQTLFYADGFLRTGDRASMNHEGFLFLIDRIKDMILVSGFNVYPNEVEHVIAQLPGVFEVGVVGVKEGMNEVVKACVVKQDPSLTKEDILTHARAHLTGYKVPKIIEFYTELPKTNVGKVLRRALR